MVTIVADMWTDFLKLFEVKPEEASNALGEVGGGAVANGVVEALLEGTVQDVALPVPKLPGLIDTLIALDGPIVSGLAALAGNRDAFRLGLGLTAFGVPNWLRVLVENLIADAPGWLSTGPQVAPLSTSVTNRCFA